MKRNAISFCSAVVLSAALGACGGGGDGGTSTTSSGGTSTTTPSKVYKVSDFAGVWRGTSSDVPGVESTAVVRADGSFWSYAYNATSNLLSVGIGTATVESNTLVINGLGYVAVEGAPPTQAETRLQGTPGVSLSGTTKIVGTSTTGAIQLSFDKATSSLTRTVADVAGSWTGAVVGNGGGAQVLSFAVSGSGRVDVSFDGGCTATGQVTSAGGPTLDIQLTYSATTCNRPRTERGVLSADATKAGVILGSGDKLVGGFMVLSRR